MWVNKKAEFEYGVALYILRYAPGVDVLNCRWIDDISGV